MSSANVPGQVTRLAHVSDFHLAPVPFPWSIRLKPVLGWLNRWRERDDHDREVLDRLIDAVISHAPDHTIVTGDVIELGLDAEWAAAQPVLTRLGAYSLAPGNHDAYTAGPNRRYGGNGDPRDAFPQMFDIGPVRLIVLCTGLPTWLFSAEGALGARQLARLSRMLRELDRDVVFPVIALHHPPAAEHLFIFKRLRDRAALLRILREERCELVLHGHLHRFQHTVLPGPGHDLHLIGAASASSTAVDAPRRAAFNLITIARIDGRWDWRAEQRGLRQAPD